MAIALVGSEGAVASAAAATITPTIPQSTTSGNYLRAWISAVGTTAGIISSTSTGWAQVVELHSGTVATALWEKVNCGAAEANPTFTSSTAAYMRAKVNEYSGVATTTPTDKIGSASGTTSPLSIATSGVDAASGELVTAAFVARYSASATKTFTDSLNNGASVTANSNDGATSAPPHYDFCSWGITTGNSVADTDSLTYTTTNITIAAAVIASTKAATGGVSVTPAAASLVLATFAPTVTTPQTFTPANTTLTLTGFAPTLTIGVNVQPAAATLTLATFAPTVLTPRLLTPPGLALTLTGFAPAVLIPQTVTPGLLALLLATFAPTVSVGVGGVAAGHMEISEGRTITGAVGDGRGASSASIAAMGTVAGDGRPSPNLNSVSVPLTGTDSDTII